MDLQRETYVPKSWLNNAYEKNLKITEARKIAANYGCHAEERKVRGSIKQINEHVLMLSVYLNVSQEESKILKSMLQMSSPWEI